MKIDFYSLTQHHLHFQKGCYFTDFVETQDAWYAWSNRITDVSWNSAFPKSPAALPSVAWLLKIAHEHNRTPAIVVPAARSTDSYKSHPAFANIAQERWMLLDIKEWVPPITKSDLHVDIKNGAPPQNEFLEIFGGLFEDAHINEHFRQYYIPALREATQQGDYAVRHLVGFHDNVPTCCASIYVRNGIAGLYNVGTIAQKQKNGWGHSISIRAINQAILLGAEHVFLQCEVGNHVEQLYSRIGFTTIEVPTVLTFQNA